MKKWQVCLVFAFLLCNQGCGFLFDSVPQFNFGDFGDFGDFASDIKDAFDLSSFTQSALNNLKNLPNNILSALKNPADLLKLSLRDLSSIPTDIFGSLSSASLKFFNASTVQAIAKKFTTASTSVITHFFSNIPTSTFVSSLSSLQNLNFQQSQLNGLAKAYKKAIGDVSTWTKKVFSDFGKLTRGLSSVDLGKISKSIFDDVLQDLPIDSFSWSQTQGIFRSAKSAWGNFEMWTQSQLQKLKSSAVFLPASNLAKLKSSAISGLATNWNSLSGWTRIQKATITNKLKTSWGQVSSWTTDNIKKIGNLVDGLNVQDFSQLNFDALIPSSALADVTTNSWLNNKQLGVISSKLKAKWGPLRRWTAQQIAKAGRSLKALLPSEILSFNITAIADRFDDLANDCGFSFSQANALLDRFLGANISLPSAGQLSNWANQNFDNLKCLARGFVCGEFRQLAQGVVRKATNVIRNSDWSLPQLQLLVKNFGSINNLEDLKGLASGVSREMISNDLDWDTLRVANLSGDVLGKFDNAQLMEMAEKGLQWITSGKESADDFWRADKIKSYTRVLRGLSRNAISQLPQESFSDFVSALSDIADATQGQIKTALDGFKMYNNISKLSHVRNLSAIDIAEIGPIVISFDLDELRALTPDACQEALIQIARSGDNFHRWASETKLVSIAKWAVDCLKAVEPQLSALTSDHVMLLDHLVEFLDDDSLKMISKDAVQNSLSTWGSFADADEHGVEKFASLVKKYLKLNTLTVQDVVNLGNIIRGLSISDIEMIPDNVIAGAVSEIGEIFSLDVDRVKALVGKVKKIWGTDVQNWSGSRLKSLGRLVVGLSNLDIKAISPDAFDDVVDLLGKFDDWTSEQSQAGINLAKKIWGELKAVTPQNLKRLGNLLTSLTPEDVGSLINKTFSCDDSLYDLGQVKGWTSDQLSKVIERAKAQFGSVGAWSGEFLNNLRGFAKGLSANDFKSLSFNVLKQGLGSLGKLDLELEKKKAVIQRLVQSGDVSTWSRSFINELGSLLEGLEDADLLQLPPEALDGIDADTVPQLGSLFSKMNQNQLTALAPEQVRALSAAQVSELRAENLCYETVDGDSLCPSTSTGETPTGGALASVLSGSVGLFSVIAVLFLK